ncbi:MAG: M24 family metallopeptidase [Armatimonadota bacterium]
MPDRIGKLRQAMDGAKVDGLVVSDRVNVSYLSGFSGDAGLLYVSPSRQYLITDSRFDAQAAQEAPEFALTISSGKGYFEALGRVIRRTRAGRIGVEADHLTYGQARELRQHMTGRRMVATRGLAAGMRAVKSAAEIAAIRRAVAIGDGAWVRTLRRVRAGMTERELSGEIERAMRIEGADKFAFGTIAASGPNAAMPHAPVTGRVLRERDVVKADFGAVRDSYCSDITRTIFIGGKPKRKQEKMYRVALEAQLLAEEAAEPGMAAAELDAVARQYITNAGFGDEFKHGLGHGIGRAVHEMPSISQKSKDVLEPGMVITIEPGIYSPGYAGVRIEDVILITENGSEVLTQAPKWALS